TTYTLLYYLFSLTPPSPTHIYPLSLHDALPISTKGYTKSNRTSVKRGKQAVTRSLQFAYRDRRNKKRSFRQLWNARINAAARLRSEEHTSELQSPCNLVCRLLLEKKKKKQK